MQGDILAEPADALVSPANSFGEMGGGLDLAIRDCFGFVLQTRVQEQIRKQHYGELLVGQAIITPLSHASFSYPSRRRQCEPQVMWPNPSTRSLPCAPCSRSLMPIPKSTAYPFLACAAWPGKCLNPSLPAKCLPLMNTSCLVNIDLPPSQTKKPLSNSS